MTKGTALVTAALSAFAVLLFVYSYRPRIAVINWADLRQEIDGFGGSCADFVEPLPTDMADFFFTPGGIGLSLLRAQAVPSMAECESFFGPGGGQCVAVPSGATTLKGELAVAQQAVARGVKVWSTPWSPPAAMKTNDSFVNGGSLLPQTHSVWADSLAKYVKLMESNGVPIYAMSVQNEPDLVTNYGSATYTGEQLRDFVPKLKLAFRSAGVEQTKIMIAEASSWDFSLVTLAMSNPAVASDVDILAAHGYGTKTIGAPINYGKRVWQTEDSSQSSVYDGSIKDGLAWASKIHKYLTIANVNAWHWWFLSDGPKYGSGTDNSALTDIGLHYPKRAYVTGQWSKFVRPGWFRIGVRYFGHLEISAFKDPEGKKVAIVVVNSSSRAVRQKFSLDGVSAQSVIPWITSEKLSLSAQAPVSMKGTEFEYDLPPSSVTTFSGTISN